MVFTTKKHTFALQYDSVLRHRGELSSFCLSENLENSCSKATHLKAHPPVGSISTLRRKDEVRIYLYGCELNFILFATGIPEPSDRECQGGSHFMSLDQ